MPIVAEAAERLLQGKLPIELEDLAVEMDDNTKRDVQKSLEQERDRETMHLLIELRETLIMRFADGVVEIIDPDFTGLLQRIDAVLVGHGCAPKPLNATPTVVIEPTP